MSWVLLAIVGYVVLQFLIGAWVSRRMASETDYILAGRKLGTGLVVFSVFATYFGAEAIVATGGTVYDEGLAGGLVDPVAYAAAIVLVGLMFARALWSRGLTTFADLFRKRYSPGVEKLAVIVLVPGSIIWAAAQIRAFGQILDANSGIGLPTAIMAASVLVGAYSVVGGLLADAITDVIQGVVVLLGLILLGTIVAGQVGGVTAGIAHVEPARLVLHHADSGLLQTLEAIAIPICGTIVAVELISRFLGARSAEVAATGTALAGVIYLAVGMVPVFLGLVGAGLLPGLEDSEQVVSKLAEAYMPGPLYVVFVGAVVSAILSVVHSALHAPAAQVFHNIVARLETGLSDGGRLWGVRLTVMALSIVAFLLSYSSEGIHDLVETASAFGSAGVFVATLFALFTTFGGPLSAYTSIMAGMLVWVGARYGLGLATPYLLGLGAALVGYVGAALIEKRREE
ncbi:MAG TPA: sodium:solute symporter family protein [Hyphomicrobiaceae bacterium]|nr:sodium:solute symporter family protein [Hyphomicrobiaceae bacterium]